MTNTSKKILVGIGAGIVLVMTSMSSTFANTNIDIVGNGRNSHNEVRLSESVINHINQLNSADIHNMVNVHSDTGNNHSNDNLGDAYVRSGDSTTVISITHNANHNMMGNGGGMGGNTHNDTDHTMDQKWYGLQTWMSGNQEVPGPGDPDAQGMTRVRLNPDGGQVCVWMHVWNIAPATAAHIHAGKAGVAGPVVITLPTPDAMGYANGCVTADMNMLKAIQQNPSDYYVNVHNASYPNGALRGQLSW